MTSFAKKFPGALALLAFGVTGFIAVITGAQIPTALGRAIIAGALFFLLGKLVAIVLFYDTPAKAAPPGEESGETKEKT